MESLKLIRNEVSTIANFDFLLKLGYDTPDFEDDEIAEMIKGDYYKKTLDRINTYAERGKQTLASLGGQVENYRNNFEDAIHRAKTSDPGSFSGGYYDRSDPASVARHNQRVEEYNNQLDLHRRMVDQSHRAKERYEDIQIKYNEKKQDIEEQIREKMEGLKPALDKDILSFLGKMQQLAYDGIHNKMYFFEGFVYIFMAKKSYVYLYDKIDDAMEQRAASDIFKKLEDELEIIVKNNRKEIKEGLAGTFSTLHHVFLENKNLYKEVKAEFEKLPYDDCEAHTANIEENLNKAFRTQFSFKDIIDPRDLARVEDEVKKELAKANQTAQDVKELGAALEPTFQSIATIKESVFALLEQMKSNEANAIADKFNGLIFILGVFNEEDQDDYLKKHKEWLEEIQKEIEESQGVVLTKWVREMFNTHLFIGSTKNLIGENAAFKFLLYQTELANKHEDLMSLNPLLQKTLQEINRVPEEQSATFLKDVENTFWMLLLPIGNLIACFQLKQKITDFASALSSNNTSYGKLRKTLLEKMKLFSSITLGLIAICVVIGFIFSGGRTILLGIGISYLASFFLLSTEQKRLSNWE